jgi:hypothetical protein
MLPGGAESRGIDHVDRSMVEAITQIGHAMGIKSSSKEPAASWPSPPNLFMMRVPSNSAAAASPLSGALLTSH